jgi:hypothetical protein
MLITQTAAVLSLSTDGIAIYSDGGEVRHSFERLLFVKYQMARGIHLLLRKLDTCLVTEMKPAQRKQQSNERVDCAKTNQPN